MNVHFPQDEISRAEAINIVDANKQYIGPRSGDAVRGLIQVYFYSYVHCHHGVYFICSSSRVYSNVSILINELILSVIPYNHVSLYAVASK